MTLDNGVTYTGLKLNSGGSIQRSEDWDMWATRGPWTVTFPFGFPDELQEAVEAQVNEEIPWGCCGGCI